MIDASAPPPPGPQGLEARSNLTRSQFLIWTGQQLAPDAPIYNMGWRFDLDRAIDPATFRRAFDGVVAGCDALRTVVRQVDGVPRQAVVAGAAGSLEVVDAPPADIDAWISSRTVRPFDIARESFSTVLLRRAADRWTWILVQHHLVADAASGAVILERVGRAYADLAAGACGPEAALPSFAAWVERERGRRDDAAVAYWAGVTAEPLRPPRLYARAPKPAAAASRRHLVPLGAERTARLELLVSRPPFQGLTPRQGRFQVFLTLLAAWVARVSAERAFALGVVTHGRRSTDEKRTAGLFMEIFPLDVRIAPGESFDTLHRRLADGAFDLLRHAAPGTSSAEGHARFNVVLNYIPTAFGSFAGAPARVEWLDHRHCDPTHALWLDVMEFDGSGAPVLGLRFNESAVAPDLQTQATGEILRLLDALLADPDAAVDGVALAADIAASVALTAAPPPDPPDAPDILSAFATHRAAAPEAVAIEGDGGVLTRAELDARADSIAEALRVAGVAPGDLVGAHLRRSPDLVAALLGILRAGAAFVPLDPAQPAGRLDAIAAEAGLRLTLTHRTLDGHWGGGGRRLLVDDLSAAPAGPVPPAVASDALAYVIFTSGSTGRPKGVAVGRRALARYARWAQATFGAPASSTWALHSAIGFDLTLTSIFAPLVGGGAIRIYREADGPGDLSILRVFADDAVDVVKLTPAHLALVLEDAAPVGRIRTLVLGGEDLPTVLAGRARALLGEQVAILNEYGPTEATVGCMVHAFDPARDLEASVPIGRAAEATRIYVLDPGGHPVPDDVVGELHVGGPDRLAQGYLGQPEATAQAFLADPFVPGARMYRTGDLASVRPDGVLRYHGRGDEQVKIAGVRVDLAEIRRAVLAHPAITDCALGFAAPRRAEPRRCRDCGLGDDHPEAEIDASDRCRLCRDFERYRGRAAAYFRTIDDLAGVVQAGAARRRGAFDCLMLLSGGKDSTYALCRLAEITPRILCATLDNGYIADGAKENIGRVCAALGVEHRFIATPFMNEIFADSLARHANVCNGCFKTIYTLGLQLAREEGIPQIVTGLSRGQLFETRLAPELFIDGEVSAADIDRTVVEARKAYHRLPDVAARRLNGMLFADDTVFREIAFVDFYRYCDVAVDEVYRYLADRVGWLRPGDTGRSTNCLINDVGIAEHKRRRGYHNYALPYSWDVRMGHKTRAAALAELDDDIDAARVERILDEIGARLPAAAAQGHERLVCHYVAAEPIDPRSLRRHLAALLRRETIPSALVPVARLPLTPNGKVDRAALPDPDRAAPEPTRPAAPPTTETETRLLAIWRQVLDRPAIGVDDNFFECGGDSIGAIRVAAAAARSSLPVTAVDVLRLQTVTAVAAAAAGRRDAPQPDAARPRSRLDARSVARLTELFGTRPDG